MPISNHFFFGLVASTNSGRLQLIELLGQKSISKAIAEENV